MFTSPNWSHLKPAPAPEPKPKLEYNGIPFPEFKGFVYNFITRTWFDKDTGKEISPWQFVWGSRRKADQYGNFTDLTLGDPSYFPTPQVAIEVEYWLKATYPSLNFEIRESPPEYRVWLSHPEYDIWVKKNDGTEVPFSCGLVAMSIIRNTHNNSMNWFVESFRFELKQAGINV